MERLLPRPLIVLLAAAAMVAAGASVAQAVHWPFFGGDAGHSGYQPVDEGTVPLDEVYARIQDDEQNIRTSILTTAGPPDRQRVIYGTSNGHVHLQELETGLPVGEEAGAALDSGLFADDTFGGGDVASVSMAETSSAAGLGQVYAVHNDVEGFPPAPDISIARIDEETGELGEDTPLEGTEGFAISSSVVMTPPNENGDRALYFVASDGGDDSRLFRVAIANAASPDAQIDAEGVTSTEDIDATALASPTLVYLEDAEGQPAPFIAVGRVDGQVTTYPVAAEDLATATPGPATDTQLPVGEVQTPVVPVASNGNPPGSVGTGVETAPALYVTVDIGTETVVHRLRQEGSVLKATATSTNLAGSPAPAAATSVEADPGGPADGKVVVTTSVNLYLLDADSLEAAGQLSPEPLNAEEGMGFSRTTAAVSGDLAYVARDNGQQLVLDLADAQPVSEEDFAESEGNGGPSESFGQPSISRGYVQFASDLGLFVYRNTDTQPPTVTLGADPPEGARVSGTVTFTGTASDARGISSFGIKIGDATERDFEPDSGSPFTAAGAAYSVAIDTRKFANGTYTLAATATDEGELTTTTPTRTIVIENRTDTGTTTTTGTTGTTGPPPPPPGEGPCTNVLPGTPAADVILGSPGADLIRAGDGDDTVDGRDGDDCLDGEAGRDRVSGGEGRDRVLGGAGNDRLGGGGGADRVQGDSGRDRVQGGRGDDFVLGEDGSDLLAGGADADRLFGGSDRDDVRGEGGNDRLSGGAGRDRLSGGPGADRLSGSGGDHRLSGGPGGDRIAAGSGSNRVSAGAGDDSVNADNGRRDRVTCGTGRDRVRADRRDRVSRSCERVVRRGR